MTVDEAISLLREFNPSMRVVVPGYETGVDDVKHIALIEIRVREWNKYIPDYDGQHTAVKPGNDFDEMAVLLTGQHKT